MQIAETVTFGGSGLNRAAEVREDADALREMWAEPDAQTLVIWRGKPLWNTEGTGALVWLPNTHRILGGAFSESVFLGLEGTAARFAVTIDDWADADENPAENTFLDTSVQQHPDLPATAAFVELRQVMALLTPRDAELAATAKALFSWHESHQFCAQCGTRSTMTQAGWQRTCGACGAAHFPRTDPVVIMLITHGNSVLLGRSPGWPDGMYSTLAGFVEPGEPIEAAVRREVLEEAGIAVGAVDYLASQPWPFPTTLMVGCKGVALNTDITIDPKEIEDAIWVSRERLLGVFAGEDTEIFAARQGSIAQFLLWNWMADRLD